MNWIEAVFSLQNNENESSRAYVLVTILETQGSAPRSSGSKMVVTRTDSFDSIGGGALEYEAIQIARELLNSQQKLPNQRQHTQSFNLSKDLKQCCGGVVNVFFEVFYSRHFDIVVFGAGHIGKALMKVLEDIDCSVKWFDTRADQFPKQLPSHIKTIIMNNPEMAVESCEKESYFLILTHDHGLDQQLCEAVLARRDSQYCGLIGSETKNLKFKQRLLKKGFSQKELKHLSCPMGLSSIKTKHPMEIAVSIIARLLELKNKIKHEKE